MFNSVYPCGQSCLNCSRKKGEYCFTIGTGNNITSQYEYEHDAIEAGIKKGTVLKLEENIYWLNPKEDV